jgi:protease-4
MTDEIYEDFKVRVSTARSIPKNDVDQLAQGKVYLGEEAKRLGLVNVCLNRSVSL